MFNVCTYVCLRAVVVGVICLFVVLWVDLVEVVGCVVGGKKDVIVDCRVARFGWLLGCI